MRATDTHSPVWLLLVLGVGACAGDRFVRTGEPPDPLPACSDEEPCPDGQVCVFGECEDIDTFVCKGAQVPLVTIDPLTAEFGEVPYGTTGVVEVYVQNIGECLLNVIGVGLSDDTAPGFDCSPCDLISYPQPVAPQQALKIDATYSPSDLGEAFGSLLIRTDDETAGDDGLITVDLHAVYSGIPVVVLDPMEVNFGYVDSTSGGTRTENVRISNQGTGNAVLEIDFVYVLPGADISIPASLDAIRPEAPVFLNPFDAGDPSTWIDVPITFSPTGFADYETSLVVVANAGTGDDSATVSARLAGSSLGPPVIQVSPTDIAFPEVGQAQPLEVGEVGFRQVTISNLGQSELAVSMSLLDSSGDFSFMPSYLAPIQPGGAVAVSLFYNPTVPSDPVNPADPHAAADAFFLVDSNDPVAQAATTVNLHGWAKRGLFDDVLKVEMTFENADTSWTANDYRDVDMELESPLGFSCKKPRYEYGPDGNGGYVVVNTTDYCEMWTNTGLEGTTTWISAGVYEEPERVVLYGLGQDLADGQTFKVNVYYIEDCSNIPTGMLADLLGIGTSVLLGALGGYVGVPIPVPPDEVSDLISENCWDRASSLVTVKAYVNGIEVAAPEVRLNNKGAYETILKLKRSGGAFVVVP